MTRHLVVTNGPDKGRVFHLTDTDTLLIGRGQAASHSLTDPAVSRIHCQVAFDGEKVEVTDFGSRSGTFVNAQRVAHQELEIGDVIHIGATQLRLVGEGASEDSTVLVPPTPAEEPAARRGILAPERLHELKGKLFSHYQVGAVLAQGQHGIIFQSRDVREHYVVALKILWPEFSRREDDQKRFVRAMKTMLPLHHPNLVSIYNAGKNRGYCWIAMELVSGENLGQMIERQGPEKGCDWRFAFRVARHVGQALDFAHQNRIIHRNVTPTNVLIRAQDKLAKLGDLMLAKAIEGTRSEQITRPGAVVGEIAYMSPERTQGPAALDARSDIYSLGATLYAVLAGKPPFEGKTLMQTMSRIRKEDPPALADRQWDLPAPFARLIRTMMAKRPEDRFQTASELLAELDRIGPEMGVG
jgi:serine/threonine protein kinase